MRISDWSSDVCSSDLSAKREIDPGARADHHRRRTLSAAICLVTDCKSNCRASPAAPRNDGESKSTGVPSLFRLCEPHGQSETPICLPELRFGQLSLAGAKIGRAHV